MDYDKFKKDYEAFEEWNRDKDWERLDKETPMNNEDWDFSNLHMYNQANLKGAKQWLKERDKNNLVELHKKEDMVNSPSHYTRGKQEVIDIIEEAIQDAPDVKPGMLQAQTLKYLLRLWLKGNALQDAQKAQWYLNRLIESLK